MIMHVAYAKPSLDYRIQACSNNAKFTAQRLAGQEVPVFEDTETTLAQLRERISRTVDVLKAVDPHAMDGREDKEVLMKTMAGEYKVESGQRYVSEFQMPNFFFNMVTAYGILRAKGVPLGMLDYLTDAMTPVKTE